jgi:hypothetical protein
MGGIRRFRQFLAARRVEIGIVVLVVIGFGPVVADFSAQPASRYALTASIADYHTVDLSHYEHILGVDRAEYHGHLRSDKAPGQPVLLVPVYLVGRALGLKSPAEMRRTSELGVWWESLWSSLLPLGLLLALMYAACARYAKRGAALATIACFGLGTMMLELSVNLFGHILAALFGFAAWFVLDRAVISPRRAFAAGALAAFAVCVEYETGIVAFALLGYVLWRHRRQTGSFLLGAVGPALFLAVYQWRAFGKPWHTPSAYYAGVINGTSRGGYKIPGIHEMLSVFSGPRGLLIGAPIAIVAIPVAVWTVRKGSGRVREHAIVALAIAVPYLLLTAGWSGLPTLEEPGPRYLVPMLPFLAVPLAALWHRVARASILATVWGAMTSFPATFCYLLLGIGQWPIPEMLRRLLHGEFQATTWSMAFGRLGVVLYAASVGAAVWWFVRMWKADVAEPTRHRAVEPTTSQLVAR